MKLWYWQQKHFIKVEMKKIFLFKPWHIKIIFQISWTLDHFISLAKLFLDSWTRSCFQHAALSGGGHLLKLKVDTLQFRSEASFYWALRSFPHLLCDIWWGLVLMTKLWAPLTHPLEGHFGSPPEICGSPGSWLEQWPGIWGLWVSSPSLFVIGRVMFSQAGSDRANGNGCELKQERFRLHVSKEFFTARQ